MKLPHILAGALIAVTFSTFVEEITQAKVEIKTNSPANAVVSSNLAYSKN